MAKRFRMMAAVCLFALAVLAWPRTGLAWEDEGPRFNVYTQGYGRADTDDGGSYSKVESGVTAGYKWLTFSYTRTKYDWSDSKSVNFSDGEPWDELNRLALDASFDGYVNEWISWFAAGTLISAFEDQIWDSFSFVPRGGLKFTPAYDWSVRLGAAGFISPVRPIILPLVGVEWRNELDYGLSASVGFPATRVQYRFNDVVSTRLAARWSRDIYRLSNDSSVAKKGYVEESGYTGGAYLDITPLERLKLTVGAELLFDRKLRLYDKGGDEFTKTDVDPALGAVFRVGYSF